MIFLVEDYDEPRKPALIEPSNENICYLLVGFVSALVLCCIAIIAFYGF